MTSIVGIFCRDGVVLGTDSSTTFTQGQNRTIEQLTQKLEVIGGRILVAGTGSVGMGQRFCEVVRLASEQGSKIFGQQSAVEIGKTLSKSAIDDFASTKAKEGMYGAMVGFPRADKHHLCEFDVQNFQPELKNERIWYCSMGSAQQITDPFLAFIREIFWEKGPPSLHEGVFAATWTLDHAIKVNPGGVNGPAWIGVLKRNEKGQMAARILDDSELGEHRQNIAEAKERLRGLPRDQQPPGAPDVPKPA